MGHFYSYPLAKLRDGTSQNPLSDEDILSLWTPRLTITNGLSEFDTKVTEDSVGMLLSYVRKRSKADKPDKEVDFVRYLPSSIPLGQAEARRVVGENRGEAVVQGGGDCQRADRALDAGQEAMHHTLTIHANHEIHYIYC